MNQAIQNQITWCIRIANILISFILKGQYVNQMKFMYKMLIFRIIEA